jgi:hypothetical protein
MNLASIAAAGDTCSMVDGNRPVRRIGETWLIAGHYDSTKRSVARIGETSFPVVSSVGEPEPQQLRALRRAIANARR